VESIGAQERVNRLAQEHEHRIAARTSYLDMEFSVSVDEPWRHCLLFLELGLDGPKACDIGLRATSCREASGRNLEQLASFLETLDVMRLVSQQQRHRFDDAIG